MIKEKKCKGQNKAISFNGCGKNVNVAFRKYGLCSSCYAEFLTETEAGKIIMQKAVLKVQKPRLEFEAGHHYSANSFTTLKFNLDNINGQCFFCNNKLEGNFSNYALNLPKRIGIDAYNELVRLASIDKQFEKVWNLENLKEIRENVKRLNQKL